MSTFVENPVMGEIETCLNEKLSSFFNGAVKDEL